MIKHNFKKKKILNIILIILGAFLLSYLLYLLFRPINNVNEEFIDEYYNYLGSNDLSKCEGLYLYNDEKTTKESLKDTQMLCNAYLNLETNNDDQLVLDKDKNFNYCTYQKMKFAVDNYDSDKCTIMKISKERMSKEVQAIYNDEVGEDQDFNIDDNNICRYKNDYYYCGLLENFVYSLKETPKVYRSIYKTIESADKVEVYDYFLKTLEQKCYNNYVSNEDIAKCSQKFAKKEEVKYSLLKKYGTLYKHVFKKNNETDQYYWVETTPLEK